MGFQTVFKRYEVKYMMTEEQKQKVLQAMEPYMALDGYGRTSIRNLYFDTDQYRLIRCSMDKPAYKEKLRVRSYGQADINSTVFVELKKKYQSVVYKRRIALSESDAMQWLTGAKPCPENTQISREVDYFLAYYQTLRPVVFLAYEREAYYEKSGGAFRVTFDDTILCRQEMLSLESEAYGALLLPEGMVLMEIKCTGGMPLWMSKVLSEQRIYHTSFSKYGAAYKQVIFPNICRENANHDREENKNGKFMELFV